mmetsp:Transcript_5880/g.12962  ORF Transcript_5880/g.12962 Transcript_5880/m.12962 type:complete len:238 (-) Transcript_5880:7-720(-)
MPSVPTVTILESHCIHAMERTALLWPRRVPCCSPVFASYSCRLEPTIAASRCPPCAYLTPEQSLALISLTMWISSSSRDRIWIFSAKATAMYMPEGCTERPTGSSGKVFMSSVFLSAAFHTRTVQSRPVVTITFFHSATSIPVMPASPCTPGPWKLVSTCCTPPSLPLALSRLDRVRASSCCLSVAHTRASSGPTAKVVTRPGRSPGSTHISSCTYFSFTSSARSYSFSRPPLEPPP